MGMQDSSSNRRKDLPILEIAKKNRIDVSFTVMDNGFLCIDQDLGKVSAISSTEDIKTILAVANEGVVSAILAALNEKKAKESVNLVILIEERQEEYVPDVEMDGPAEVGIDQLADILSDIVSESQSYGIPGLRVGSSKINITPAYIQNYFRQKGIIKVRKQAQFTGKTTPSENTKGKDPSGKFYHDSSKNQQNQNQNQQKGQPPEATKL